MDRRDFLRSGVVLGSLGTILSRLAQNLEKYDSNDWKEIAAEYPAHRHSILNFNTGSAGNRPQMVTQAYHQASLLLNERPAYEQHIDWKLIREQVIDSLASLTGFEADSLAITRNTTEGLDLLISAVDIAKDQTFYYSTTDYPHAIQCILNRAQREGFSTRALRTEKAWTDHELVEFYGESIDNGVLLLTEMPHNTMRRMPVEKIAQVMQGRELIVLVDGAHGVGHFTQDYDGVHIHGYASSLHKWLSAPLGTGLLYIDGSMPRSRAIRNSAPSDLPVMEQLDYTGTIDFAKILGVFAALEWQETIGGIAVKANRLRTLTSRMVSGIDSMDGYESLCPARFGAMCGLRSERVKEKQLQQTLQKHGFHVKKTRDPRTEEDFLRLSVNLHLTEDQIDQLLFALQKIKN